MKDKEIGELYMNGYNALQIATKLCITEPDVFRALGFHNPYLQRCNHYNRLDENRDHILDITSRIDSMYEERFITPPHTSEFIESLITMTESKQILELGMYTGFTTLHMIRALIGIKGAKVTSVDCRPCHDPEYFTLPFIEKYFEFVEGLTPEILDTLRGKFDLVFIDSDHSVAHCEKEFQALIPLTYPGSFFVFHDCPYNQSVHLWLNEKVNNGWLYGLILPTAFQPDVPHKVQRPNLGVFQRL